VTRPRDHRDHLGRGAYSRSTAGSFLADAPGVGVAGLGALLELLDVPDEGEPCFAVAP
jgi:hypothetical protein